MAVAAFGLASMVGSGGEAGAQHPSSAIRSESGAVQALVGRGMTGSVTFRELAAKLSRSDVIVHVRFARCPGGVPACLRWVSALPGVRRLVIDLEGFGRSQNDVVALLAHELQHATEVADTPSIRDLASFQVAFAGLGWRNHDGFETAAAKEVARRVGSELAR